MNTIPRYSQVALSVFFLFLPLNLQAQEERRIVFQEQDLGALKKFTATFGAVFVDIDNNGWDDLIVSNHGLNFPTIYLNEGGSFVDKSSLLPMKERFRDRHAITVVDIDNDGDRDIFIGGGGGGAEHVATGMRNEIYLNTLAQTGEFGFTKAPDGPYTLLKTRSRSLIPVCSENGRTIDFYLEANYRETNPNMFFRNTSSESGIVILEKPQYGLDMAGHFEGMGVFFDFDRDGDRDYLGIDGESIRFFRFNKGKFVEKNEVLPKRNFRASCLAVGDLNNDGYPDVTIGVRSPQVKNDRIAYNKLGFHGAFYQHDFGDVDEVTFESAATSFDINFKVGFMVNDASDIYIGASRKNPPSRAVTGIPASDAEGKPKTDLPGFYIWKKGIVWTVMAVFGGERTEIRGVIDTGDKVENVEEVSLEVGDIKQAHDLIFLNNKGKKFGHFKTNLLTHDERTRAMALYDFDNDGYVDIVGIRGSEPGDRNGEPFVINGGKNMQISKEKFYHPQGDDDTFQSAEMAVGFFDGDGRPDFFYTTGYGLIPSSHGPYKLLKNNSKGRYNYLILQLVGVKSNRDAFGAQIELRTKKGRLLGYREVGAGYNRNQSTFKQHFGLGNHNDKVKITIKWPNGRVKKYVVKEVNRIVTIYEKKQR